MGVDSASKTGPYSISLFYKLTRNPLRSHAFLFQSVSGRQSRDHILHFACRRQCLETTIEPSR